MLRAPSWQPSAGSTPYCPCPWGSPELGTALQVCSCKGQEKGNDRFLNLLAAPYAAQYAVGIFTTRSSFCPVFSLCLPPLRHPPWLQPMLFLHSCSVASQHLAWSILWRFCPKCKNLHVLWLNFMRFLSAPISSLSSSLWKAHQHGDCSPVWCRLRTCWGCIQVHHPGHE